jgi:hypothetical protein
MKMPKAAYYLVLVVLAALLWRELRLGLLQPMEERLAGWLGEVAGADAGRPDGPTLVFQGGVTGAELSSLDIGLFVRAATRLGARVVAVAAYEFDVSQISLDVRSDVAHRHVAGSLLLPRAVGSGLAPAPLPGLTGAARGGENFLGSYSTFPADRGWTAGFLNLPATGAQRNRVPILGLLRGEPVPSFALAVYLASLSAQTGPTEEKTGAISTTPSSDLRLGRHILPLDAEGMIPLSSTALRNLRRLDMDDLLLEVERVEQGRPANAAVTDLIADRLVILGTLLPERGSTIRLGEGRQLSLSEFQGLAVASLLQALQLPRVPLWGDLVSVAFSLLLAAAIHPSSRDRACALFLAGVAGIFLAGFLVVQQFAVVPSILLPSTLLLTALLLRLVFHQKAAS